MTHTSQFYASLKEHRSPIHRLIRNSDLFEDVPADWVIVITDVLDSTTAVQKGLHNKVNLAATGSVVAVMNTVGSELQNCSIPYFFGGDGATFIIPPDQENEVALSLETYSSHVKKNLNLILRTGLIKVSDILIKGDQLKIIKVKLNPFLTIPLVLGNGLQRAEDIVKSNFTAGEKQTVALPSLNLNGMECRWDQISPRDQKHKVVCLIVNCPDETLQPTIYGDVLDMIDITFGSLVERQPITVSRLKLRASIAKIKEEMIAKIGSNKISYLIKNFLITYFGSFYFKYIKEGRSYLKKISQLSDTIMMDGTLNTVMEGSSRQVEMLTNYLDLLEREGKIKYGLHATYASVMSCYVQDRNDNHIHFVDGTEGGFTSAAIVYKGKYK